MIPTIRKLFFFIHIFQAAWILFLSIWSPFAYNIKIAKLMSVLIHILNEDIFRRCWKKKNFRFWRKICFWKKVLFEKRELTWTHFNCEQIKMKTLNMSFVWIKFGYFPMKNRFNVSIKIPFDWTITVWRDEKK